MRIAFVIFIILFFCGIAQASIPMGALPYALSGGSPPAGDKLLLETGDVMLAETGDKFLNEAVVAASLILLETGDKLLLETGDKFVEEE